MTPTRPRTAPLAFLALVLAAGLATSPWARAQDGRVLAAQKEGKVVWYTSLALTSSEKVAKLFEAAHPGVKVEVHRTGSQRILQRVMQELEKRNEEIKTRFVELFGA
jgi:iron(III) transport system substrate-binding protein